MSLLQRLAVSGCFVIVLSASGWGANPADFTDFSHPSVPGRLYVPPEAEATNPRPLILFLHGAGETGNNNVSQVNADIDNLLAAAKQRGAFLYAPQATTFTWADATRTSTVMSMIDQALVDFDIDSSRLYVTGLSMGGGGTWNMFNRFDDRFAAAVPICGVPPGTDFSGANLLDKPTWAFHARNDTTVSPTASRSVVNQVLAAASAAPITFPATTEAFSTVRYSNDAVGMNYTEWPDGGHGIWGPVYGMPDLYDWMFSQTLSAPEPVAPASGGQVIVNNRSPFYPIGDQFGDAIPANSGFMAVGTFAIADEVVSATTAASLDLLANSFTQFGASIPMGVRGVEGLVFGSVGAPLTASDPLLGANVYVVVGDGHDIRTSDSLFIYKSNSQFNLASPSFQLNLGIDSNLSDGQVLLGSHGMVFANRLGGLRAGIVAAAVNVPEPAVGFLAAFVALASISTRGKL